MWQTRQCYILLSLDMIRPRPLNWGFPICPLKMHLMHQMSSSWHDFGVKCNFGRQPDKFLVKDSEWCLTQKIFLSQSHLFHSILPSSLFWQIKGLEKVAMFHFYPCTMATMKTSIMLAQIQPFWEEKKLWQMFREQAQLNFVANILHLNLPPPGHNEDTV